MKKFDDTPNVAMKSFVERVKYNSEKVEYIYNIYNIYNEELKHQILLARKTQPKTGKYFIFRESLFKNFQQIAKRIDSSATPTYLFEAFMEIFIRTFSDMANAKINFFHPLPMTAPDNLFNRVKLKLLKSELEAALRILNHVPGDKNAIMKACRLIEENRALIESTQDPELEAMLSKLEEYL
jgi:hypothetical protein